MVISGGMAGLGRHWRGGGHSPLFELSGYDFFRIRVHGHHRGLAGQAESVLCNFFGIFFAGILVGGDAIQISLGLPAATVEIFNGTLLIFLIMGDFFTKNKVRLSTQKA
jgi:ABC-type uncharacterized transport system permease subunit